MGRYLYAASSWDGWCPALARDGNGHGEYAEGEASGGDICGEEGERGGGREVCQAQLLSY
jgi:hypothetical protein